jgi:hypothetical protein
MAWRIVKQPNGLFARWSDIVDNFTDANASEEQALELCSEKMGKEEARTKVQCAIDDLNEARQKGSGLDRWNDCLNTIKIIHGEQELKDVLAYIDNQKNKRCVM